MKFGLLNLGWDIGFVFRGRLRRVRLPVPLDWKTLTWPIRMRLRNGKWPVGGMWPGRIVWPRGE